MSIEIVPRATWGAAHHNGDISVPLPLQGVYVHHTVGGNPGEIL